MADALKHSQTLFENLVVSWSGEKKEESSVSKPRLFVAIAAIPVWVVLLTAALDHILC
ncbi:hypothetical protein BX666DRAFT_2029328 [Dichotomocladium elegans]|nr:hypothetical protein BX666DRAFT_2029328 [Dichotomocladium elegans]